MSSREYVKQQIDILPESVIEKVVEFISYLRFENDTEYLCSIPGMKESIMKGKATPIEECLDSVGWDIS